MEELLTVALPATDQMPSGMEFSMSREPKQGTNEICEPAISTSSNTGGVSHTTRAEALGVYAAGCF